ncbi:MAG: hypothetical protein WBS20_17150 [Lysobacterales bacterium]
MIRKFSCKKYAGLVLLLLTALLCASCGSKLVRGESPVIRITELSHRDNSITLQLNLRNLNGVDLDVLSIDFRLTVNENKDELVVYNGPVGINIVANGVESWSLETPESDANRKLLNSLEEGGIMSLPYQLKGSIRSADDGTMRFEYEGHLYPLPGRPGRFR